jgi:preprotein translocase subunit SecG
MLYYPILIVYILTCFVLMLVILLQQGKGGDIANAFGGGSSQAAFGARSGATVLSRATAICFVLFIVGALSLSIMGTRGPGSVLGGRPGPRSTAPAAAPGATTPAPVEGAKPAEPPPASAVPAPAAPEAPPSGN